MKPEVAATIMKFMERVDLKGGEVPVFASCMLALQGIAKPVESPMGEGEPEGEGEE